MAATLKKELKYVPTVLNHLGKLLEEQDCEDFIGMEELMEEDNFKYFMHAISTVVPNIILKNLTTEKRNNLEFTHFANQLCVEYLLSDKEES